eukprot:3695919-Prymnesium_polylepis.1
MYSERRRQQRDLQLERNFMAVTSHEVRNPLNGTVGWLRFLQARLVAGWRGGLAWRAEVEC